MTTTLFIVPNRTRAAAMRYSQAWKDAKNATMKVVSTADELSRAVEGIDKVVIDYDAFYQFPLDLQPLISRAS